MRSYEFYCRRCGKPFFVKLAADVYDRNEVRCPVCGAQTTEEVVGPLAGNRSKPEPLAGVGSQERK